MKNTNESGKAFETYVESIYQGLGFKTKHDVSIWGQQIDIEAKKKVKGMGDLHLLIECKWRSKAGITNQQVMDFNSAILTLRQKYSFTHAVFVTNTYFTRGAKLLANENLSLVTLQELENEYFEVKESYSSFCSEYETDKIFSEYIELSGEIDGAPVTNIENYVCNAIINSNFPKSPIFFSILGDYGSGKSTLQNRILYRFGKSYLTNQSLLKPFYLELKEYNKFKNLELYITSSYLKQFGKEITYKAFLRELSNRGYILLLDGFDEMSPEVDKQKRVKDFEVLSSLLFSNSHCILTCRPSYFVTNSEYLEFIKKKPNNGPGELVEENSGKLSVRIRQESINRTFNQIKTLYIDKKYSSDTTEKDTKSITLYELSDKQITVYLEKFANKFNSECKASPSEIEKFLRDIYDLSELMTKPLLLSMIKDTILWHKTDYQKYRSEYGPAFLYEIYTKLNLDLDYDKGDTRKFLTPDERRQFASAIALSMFETTTLDVKYKTILEVVNSYKEDLKEIGKKMANSDAEKIVSDVLICSFLTRSADGLFRFIHTSFMEFFVARHFAEQLENGTMDVVLTNRLIKAEILLFIGSYCLNRPNLDYQLNNLFKKGTQDIEKRNLGIALLYSRPDHTDFLIQYVSIAQATFNKIGFTNSKFNTVEFLSVIFKKIIFANTFFTNVGFISCQFHNVEIVSCRGLLKFQDSKLESVKIKNTEKADLLTVESNSLLLTNSEIDRSRLDLKYISFFIGDTVVNSSALNFIPLEENKSRNQTEFENLEINNSSLSGNLTRLSGSASFNSCKIMDLVIHGVSNLVRINLNGGTVKNGMLKSVDLFLKGKEVELDGVKLEDCIVIADSHTVVKFTNCRFNGIQFSKGKFDTSRFSFTNCTFNTSKIELIHITSFLKNTFNLSTKGIFISENIDVILANLSTPVKKKEKFWNKLTEELFLIGEKDYNMNIQTVENKLDLLTGYK